MTALTAVAPLTTLRAHRDAGFPWRELRLVQPWKAGPDADRPGPHLLSVNEYRPHRLRDVAPIARLSAEMIEGLRGAEGFFGIASAYRPLGQITYSFSVWTTEEALRTFTLSPLHRRVMAEYRTRGYLRHVHWWGAFTTVGAGMAEATSRLDAGEGRRVGEPRDRWARGDAQRLATLTPARPPATTRSGAPTAPTPR
jgi:heme-degrading monooxygenase HmoA